MGNSSQILLELFLMYAGGKVLAEIFEQIRQPPVVGEILAGVLLGPSLLNLIHPTEMNLGMAQIGAIFLLFTVGLESKPAELLRVGWIAVLVATIGVIVPFIFGFAYLRLADHSTVEAVFVGAAMVATSVGITSRVLADLGALSHRVAQVILAAAVADDILGMIVLAVVSSLSAGQINYVSLATVTVEAVGFSLFFVFFGSRIVGRFRPAVAKLRARNSAFALSVLLCLGLSLASEHIGMAAIIGAFLAGLALADHSEPYRLRENAHPLMEFLAPFFFVLLGAQVDLRSIADPATLKIAAVICILAVISKLIGCGLGAWSLGRKDAIRIGIGMVPRGEVGLIVAAVGLNLHTISSSIYTVVVTMSIVTTLFAPPVLRAIMPRAARGEAAANSAL
jgi:Na+:H+ antiporter